VEKRGRWLSLHMHIGASQFNNHSHHTAPRNFENQAPKLETKISLFYLEYNCRSRSSILQGNHSLPSIVVSRLWLSQLGFEVFRASAAAPSYFTSRHHHRTATTLRFNSLLYTHTLCHSTKEISSFFIKHSSDCQARLQRVTATVI
jgi:hypothetical protein